MYLIHDYKWWHFWQNTMPLLLLLLSIQYWIFTRIITITSDTSVWAWHISIKCWICTWSNPIAPNRNFVKIYLYNCVKWWPVNAGKTSIVIFICFEYWCACAWVRTYTVKIITINDCILTIATFVSFTINTPIDPNYLIRTLKSVSTVCCLRLNLYNVDRTNTNTQNRFHYHFSENCQKTNSGCTRFWLSTSN